MKLITDFNDLVEYTVEETDTDDGLKVKDYFIEGIFMQAERKNRNGRVYERKVMEKALDKYVEEQVSQDRAVGELNHPAGPTVNYQNVSHKITSLVWEGNDIIGRAKILNTPMGKIVKDLIDEDVRLGVSSRGMGSITKRDNTVYVQDDFAIATIDIVQDPSAHEAFVNGVMEGVEWEFKDGMYVPVSVDESKEPKTINKDNEVFMRSFRNLMARI